MQFASVNLRGEFGDEDGGVAGLADDQPIEDVDAAVTARNATGDMSTVVDALAHIGDDDEEDGVLPPDCWCLSDALSAWIWANQLPAALMGLVSHPEPSILMPFVRHVATVGEAEAEWLDWLLRIAAVGVHALSSAHVSCHAGWRIAIKCDFWSCFALDALQVLRIEDVHEQEGAAAELFELINDTSLPSSFDAGVVMNELAVSAAAFREGLLECAFPDFLATPRCSQLMARLRRCAPLRPR